MSDQGKINRRRFLRLAGGAVGAGMLSCVGGGIVALHQPKVDSPTYSCEGADNPAKVLVAYATRAGSTGEVADAIGHALCETGLAVDVLPVSDVQSLAPYRAVVLGSAVYIGRLLRDATSFVERNQAALSQMPVAPFAVCLTIREDTVETRAEVDGYLQPIRELVTPVAEGFFAGRVSPENLPPAYRLAIKGMAEETGDFRDWKAIKAWGAYLASALS